MWAENLALKQFSSHLNRRLEGGGCPYRGRAKIHVPLLYVEIHLHRNPGGACTIFEVVHKFCSAAI